MRPAILSVIVLGFAIPGGAMAQIPDPTRPPPSALPQDGSGNPVTQAASGLQTVVIRPGGKSVAVIDGRNVVVGDTLGERRVVKISEGEVVLQGTGGREVLKVIPSIEKQPAKKPGAEKRRQPKITKP